MQAHDSIITDTFAANKDSLIAQYKTQVVAEKRIAASLKHYLDNAFKLEKAKALSKSDDGEVPESTVDDDSQGGGSNVDGKLASAVRHGMLEVPCMYGVTLSVVLTFSHIVQGNSTVDVLSQSAIIICCTTCRTTSRTTYRRRISI